MQDGICSPLWDPVTGAIPGAAWIEALTALRPGAPLPVRASLAADADDHIDVRALLAALGAYRAGGMPVCAVLEQAISRYHELPGKVGDPSLLPNAALGFDGNPLLNDYINRASLNACGLLRELGPDAGLAGVWVGNEPNLCACDLQSGDVAPPDKGSALAPEVFGALLWTTASRLRAEVPWLTTIWPAAFSQLVWFFNGPASNRTWFAEYWSRAVAYLRQCGKRPPWPWNGLSCNLEGPIGHPLPGTTSPYVQYVAYELARVKTALSIQGSSICGEWGSQVAGLDRAAMTGAYRALQASPFQAGFLFQASLMGPGSYGLLNWSVAAGLLVPGTPTPWYNLAQTLFTGGAS